MPEDIDPFLDLIRTMAENPTPMDEEWIKRGGLRNETIDMYRKFRAEADLRRRLQQPIVKTQEEPHWLLKHEVLHVIKGWTK